MASPDKARRGRYLIIDTETTGFDPIRNGLIEFACAALDDSLEIVETLALDICPPPGFLVNEESLAVNGFTEARICRGVPYESFTAAFCAFLGKHFADKPIVVGQFYPFDHAFLCAAFSRVAEERFYEGNLLGNNFIDTKSIVNYANLRARMAGEELPFPITSLSAPGGLKDTLGLGQNYESHTALGDVLATRDALIALLKKGV